MKKYIVRAINHVVENKLVNHLELYEHDYYWKHVAGNEQGQVTFIAMLQVEDDEVVYFDPIDELTPDGAIAKYDER